MATRAAIELHLSLHGYQPMLREWLHYNTPVDDSRAASYSGMHYSYGLWNPARRLGAVTHHHPTANPHIVHYLDLQAWTEQAWSDFSTPVLLDLYNELIRNTLIPCLPLKEE